MNSSRKCLERPYVYCLCCKNILRGFECAQIVHFPSTSHRGMIFHGPKAKFVLSFFRFSRPFAASLQTPYWDTVNHPV